MFTPLLILHNCISLLYIYTIERFNIMAGLLTKHTFRGLLCILIFEIHISLLLVDENEKKNSISVARVGEF